MFCIILEVMKKVATVALSLGLVLACVMRPVLATPSDEVLRANCQAVQTVMSQMEKTDAALRINRGRVYNEILDLFYAMNSRLAANKISAPGLASITEEFDQLLTEFRDLYNTYDDELNEMVDMKCQESPGGFYSQLNTVRSLRNDLNNNVRDLDQLLDDYKHEFDVNVRSRINVS